MSTLDLRANYLSRTMADMTDDLINYAKLYFPNSYQDFSEATPGRMIIELISYIGDNLAYYQNQQFREIILQKATERRNIINLAQSLFGYVPKGKSSSIADLSVYLDIPTTGGVIDSLYCPKILRGSRFSSLTGIGFELLTDLDFGNAGPSDITVLETSGTAVTKYRVKLIGHAVSGISKLYNYSVTSIVPYLKIQIPDVDVTEIVSIIDSDGNTWYEVGYLSQDVISKDFDNNEVLSRNLPTDVATVPKMLKLLRVPRRFIVRTDEQNNIYLIFGSGVVNRDDTEIIPTPMDFGTPYPYDKGINTSIRPENFLRTRTLGMAPSAGTTLTIRYRVGGGLASNVPSNVINIVNSPIFEFPTAADGATLLAVKQSIIVTNENPAAGGMDAEDNASIKQNAEANIESQNRAVTLTDYTMRVLSMPSQYGRIAKAFSMRQDDYTPGRVLRQVGGGSILPPGSNVYPPVDKSSPNGILIFILAMDNNGKLVVAPNALKRNIVNYLSKYRMINDSIYIMDACIINIGIKFQIAVNSGMNKQEVITRCIQALQAYFNISNWTIGQPICISEVDYLLHGVTGVRNVASVDIVNLTGGSYSSYGYDTARNVINGMLYPSKQISIFEVKYPNIDIEGSAI